MSTQTIVKLAREYFGVETLTTKNNSSDFHETSVSGIQKGIEAAYASGVWGVLKKAGTLALPVGTTKPPESFVLNLAKKHYPGLSTLRPQNRDSLDFHETSVKSISSMLEAAYNEGSSFARDYLKKVKSFSAIAGIAKRVI
jgi:hypothetical protein